MKISLVIPILYAPGNDLYKLAVQSVVAAWKKLPRRAGKSLSIALVFNQFPPNKKLPKIAISGVKIAVLTNALNKGFTGAVNDGVWFGAYQQQADWCLVLNDDATVDEEFFRRLIPELKSGRAIISCGVRNTDGSIQSAGLEYFPSGLTEPLTQFGKTPFFVGTVFFVSRSTVTQNFEQFGWLLANFFFAYAEDLELSVRLLRRRQKVYLHPEVLVTHLGSVTARRGSAFQLFWGYRNLLMTIILHWPVTRILMFLPWLIVGQLYCLIVLLAKGHWLVYPKIWFSIWKNREILKYYRQFYDQKLSDRYTI